MKASKYTGVKRNKLEKVIILSITFGIIAAPTIHEYINNIINPPKTAPWSSCYERVHCTSLKEANSIRESAFNGYK